MQNHDNFRRQLAAKYLVSDNVREQQMGRAIHDSIVRKTRCVDPRAQPDASAEAGNHKEWRVALVHHEPPSEAKRKREVNIFLAILATLFLIVAAGFIGWTIIWLCRGGI